MYCLRYLLIFLLFFAKAICSVSCLKDIKCTDDVLRQIYPNQNACVLLHSIPPKLQKLPFVVYPTQIGIYNTARFNFNKRFNIFPKAIILPKTKCELSSVIRYLKKKNLNFSIRSGGHCFEPGSLSPDYVIDLRHFNKIKVGKKRAYIGAGERLGPVIEKLGQQNLVIPTGTCQSVGVGGLTLGGGLGFLSRTFGLTCDVVKNITFLTADSKIIEVNNNHASDLFWALRGAGNGSYGIALGFTYKTFYVPEVSFLELKWDWDATLVSQIFAAWQQWITDLPNSINPLLSLDYSNGVLKVEIFALKVGKEPFNEWETAFQAMNPSVKLTKSSYEESAQLWADSPTAPFQKVKSIMAFQPIPQTAIQLTIDYFEQLRAVEAKFNVNFEFMALGGKLTEGDTAYFPRQATEWWHQTVNWNLQDEEIAALASIRQFYATVRPLISDFCYANDVDYDLGNEYLHAYYGDHVDRLKEIKQKYDPTNLFHWQQSIPLP